ncbi:unnamed protein product, partial [Polarella glacialis]
LGSHVIFVTGGLGGVQQAFAESCDIAARVWNVLPKGQRSGYIQGKDLNAGKDLDQRREVFSALGELYLSFEGGPGVAAEARAAVQRGATVLPVPRTGGASSGMFDFPASVLARPWFATEEQWMLLNDQEADVAKVASACVSAVESFVAHQLAVQ